MTESNAAQKSAIDLVVGRFFSVFSNRDGKLVNLEYLNDMFISGCVIVRTCGELQSVYNLLEFIASRKELLSGGELENFFEEELWERTDIFGDVAQRFCLYRKSGVLSGRAFETNGMKSIQLINTEAGWKISALAWDDERDGVSVRQDIDGINEVIPEKVS